MQKAIEKPREEKKPNHPIIGEFLNITVKPVLSSHSKIDKTKNLMTNGNLMEVESIAECSCNTFDLH